MGQWDLDLPSIYTPTFEDHPSPGSAVGSAWEMPKSFKYRGATGVARRGVCAGAMNAWAPHQHWSIMCTLIGAGAYMYMYNYTVYIYITHTHYHVFKCSQNHHCVDTNVHFSMKGNEYIICNKYQKMMIGVYILMMFLKTLEQMTGISPNGNRCSIFLDLNDAGDNPWWMKTHHPEAFFCCLQSIVEPTWMHLLIQVAFVQTCFHRLVKGKNSGENMKTTQNLQSMASFRFSL